MRIASILLVWQCSLIKPYDVNLYQTCDHADESDKGSTDHTFRGTQKFRETKHLVLATNQVNSQ